MFKVANNKYLYKIFLKTHNTCIKWGYFWKAIIIQEPMPFTEQHMELKII